MIRLAKPWIGRDELRAVEAVLESGNLVQGQQVAAFEEGVAERVGRSHGIATTNGTSALVLGLRALGVGAGDEVLCPALSWPSPAHAIRMMRAEPVFVDVHAAEWNSTAEALAAGRTVRTKAAIVIDQFGNPARAEEIREALTGLSIIEDAACALGSLFATGPCGTLGDISCFSFHPRKIITTGEGGMCVTDSDELANRLRVLRNHGQSGPGAFSEAAGNYRLTEMAGALGVAQLARLDAIIKRRTEVMARYREALSELLAFQVSPEGATPNYQTAGALVPESWTTERRDALIQALRGREVEAGPLSYAMHQLGSMSESTDSLPNAESIVARGLALPLYPTMDDSEVDTVIRVVQEVVPHV